MKTPHGRIRFLSGLLVFGALLIVWKLYTVQVVHGDTFAQKAERQYSAPQQSLFERGSIFFTEKSGGRISGATLQSGYTLAIDPRHISDPVSLYATLAELVPLDQDDFFFRARKTDDPYEELVQHLDQKTADALSERDLDGVILVKDQWRQYPGDTLAAHTLGFVGFDGEERTGRYGLERYYEDVLRRKTNAVYVNFFAEVFSNVGSLVFADSNSREGDIVTTIEPTVQSRLEQALESIESKWSAQTTGGIIIDPQSGEVYALGKTPSFNVNTFEDVEDVHAFGNPLIENVYEMGSIIKPLTIAAGLDARAITPETTYNDRGSVTVDSSTFSNYDGRARGVVSMQEVLNQSLNTGVAFAVEQMGTDIFADYMRSFGLGEETGIDLPGEVHGLIDNLNSPRTIEYYTASFGQGIALTPIATVRALSTLANGGKLITPHIVKEIEGTLGISKKIFYEPTERVIREETSETISRMLVTVVDEALAGGDVALPHYSVAAKTGTAQIADPVNGGYYDDRYLHSFFGYFPAYDPEFLIFLFVEEPVGVRYASQTLTTPFMDLVTFLINYYEVAPDR